jgi:hypothetical protein
MYGSRAVHKWLYQILAAKPEVSALVEDRIVRGFVPAGVETPYAQFFRESALDNGPIGIAIDSETLRYQVKLVTTGWSDEPLAAAAEAMHDAIIAGDQNLIAGYDITALRVGELPFDLPPEDGVPYQQLGGVYSIEVSRT